MWIAGRSARILLARRQALTLGRRGGGALSRGAGEGWGGGLPGDHLHGRLRGTVEIDQIDAGQERVDAVAQTGAQRLAAAVQPAQ